MYFLIFFAVSVLCGCAALDITPCDINEIYDGSTPVCQVNTVGITATRYALTGLPEYGIGQIEPTTLNSTCSTFFDIFKLTLIDGKCYNIVNTCRITYYEMDTENFRRITNVKCGRIVIKFSYDLSTNPNFSNIFGDVNGCGNATIILENWLFHFNNPFEFVKRNGSIYLKIDFDNGNYETKVEKRATFDVSSIRVNDRDITNEALYYMNKNWEPILDLFGGDLFQLAYEYYRDVYEKVYSNIEANTFYFNDLTPYLNEEEDDSDSEEDDDN